jgi:hypothetical protein
MVVDPLGTTTSDKPVSKKPVGGVSILPPLAVQPDSSDSSASSSNDSGKEKSKSASDKIKKLQSNLALDPMRMLGGGGPPPKSKSTDQEDSTNGI